MRIPTYHRLAKKRFFANSEYQEMIRDKKLMSRVAKELGCVAVRMANGTYQIE